MFSRGLIIVALVLSSITSAVAGEPPELAYLFDRPDFGYSIGIPKGWVSTKPKDYSVVFSGQPGKDEFFVTVALFNRQAPPSADPAETMLDLYVTELMEKNQDAKVHTRVPFRYRKDGLEIEGKQAVSDFITGATHFRQWVVILPRPGTQVVHLWTYTAAEGQFDASIPTAQAMLDSWTLKGSDLR